MVKVDRKALVEKAGVGRPQQLPEPTPIYSIFVSVCVKLVFQIELALSAVLFFLT